MPKSPTSPAQGRPVSDWVAARTHPQSYPGAHPHGGFVLVDDRVFDLEGTLADGLESLTFGGRSLAGELADRGLAPLHERFPVVAYGANRNPASLAIKLAHHEYRSPGRGLVLPTLPVRVSGVDIVGGNLTGQGYIYADMIADEGTRDTSVDVHIVLLDLDQLRAVNDSEHVPAGLYDVGTIADVALLDGQRPVHRLTGLAYLGSGLVFVSPRTGQPIACATVTAEGRTLPELDAMPMLAEAIDSLGLTAAVAAIVTPGPDPASVSPLDVATDVARYLNGQWWYSRNSGDAALGASVALEELLRSAIIASSEIIGARSRPGTAILDAASTAYAPGPTWQLGSVLRMGA